MKKTNVPSLFTLVSDNSWQTKIFKIQYKRYVYGDYNTGNSSDRTRHILTLDCLFPSAKTFLTLGCIILLLWPTKLASCSCSSRPPFCLKTCSQGDTAEMTSIETRARNMVQDGGPNKESEGRTWQHYCKGKDRWEFIRVQKRCWLLIVLFWLKIAFLESTYIAFHTRSNISCLY